MKSSATSSLALCRMVAVSCLLAGGCDDARKAAIGITSGEEVQRNAQLQQALRTTLAAGANPETRAWNEFRGYWPSAWPSEGWSYDEAGRRFQGGATAAILIEDRYVLKFMLEFEASADFQHVEFFKARYNFYEIDSVRLPREGGQEGGQYVKYNPTNQVWFGPNEWKGLVESKWDFSHLGMHVVSNAPVQNIRTLAPARW